MKLRLYYLVAVLLAFNLALVAVSAFMAVRAAQLHPMTGQLVEVDGVNLHVLDNGLPGSVDQSAAAAIPTVVLLHGASTSLLDFEPALKPLLQDKLRIISIDRPGHGYSERGDSENLAYLRADDSTVHQQKAAARTWVDPELQASLIAGALESLGVEQSIWVGHSWAGSVVLAGLLDDSINVSAGVLIAGATHPWEGGSSWHAELAVKPVIGTIFSWQYIAPIGTLVLDEAIAGVFAPETVPNDYVDDTGVVLSLRPETFQHNARDLTQLSDFLELQATRYERIEQPVLSITGSSDTVVPGWNHDARLARQVPQLVSVELEDAGHAPHHTRPDRVADIITLFIEATVTRSGAQSNGTDRRDSDTPPDGSVINMDQ